MVLNTGDPSQVANFNVTSISNVISLNNWTGFFNLLKEIHSILGISCYLFNTNFTKW
jgi:hypothetical protein